MIPFFRKLRQKLVTENRVSKYALYALGEILLVVIGILIALQINNWNEERMERNQEQAILRQLRIEFKTNLEQLDEKMESKRLLIRSVRRILDYVDHPELRKRDSLDYFLGWTTPFSTFDPIENDLASSGSLRLIRSDSLKLLLSLWTSNIKDVQEDDNSWKDYRDRAFHPFLVKKYQLRNIRDIADKTSILNQSLISSEEDTKPEMKKSIGPSAHQVDMDHLLNDPDFEDHLERAMTMNRFALSQSSILRKRILEILNLLDHEIGD
jgi:hypothetical protein